MIDPRLAEKALRVVAIGVLYASTAFAEGPDFASYPLAPAAAAPAFGCLPRGQPDFSMFLGNDASPFQMVTGDFDQDGNVDIALAVVNGIRILRGDGMGHFGPPTTYLLGLTAVSIQVADLNGDSHPDLVVIQNGSPQVSILLNDGAGAFTLRAQYEFPSTAWTAAIADFDHDGRPDVAVGHNDGITVFLGNGDGTLRQDARYQPTFADSTLYMAAADLNNDGIVDIIKGGDPGGVTIFFGQPNGTFAYPQRLYGPGGEGVSTNIILADMNGDGYLDIVAGSTNFSAAWLFLNDGRGTFEARRVAVGPITSTNRPIRVAVGDVNGDGKPDIITANEQNTISIALNQGFGTFDDPILLSGKKNQTAIAAVDLNHDSRMDIVISRADPSGIDVLLGCSIRHRATRIR